MKADRSGASVGELCQAFGISRSGYYAWRKRRPCARMRRDQALTRALVQLHEKYPALGLDSLYHMLRPDYGCSRKRVHQLMGCNGSHSARTHAYTAATNSQYSHPIAPNLLQRRFSFEQPNQAWVGDITSDRFVQYVAAAYRECLSQHGIRQSMSRRGDPYDNAVAENFFSCLKCELIHLRRYDARAVAQNAVFAYIEGFYNALRPHSAIGWIPPNVFIKQFSKINAA